MAIKYLRRIDDGSVISHPGPNFAGAKGFEEFEVEEGVNPQPAKFLAPEDLAAAAEAPASKAKKKA